MIAWVRHAGFRVLPVVLAIGFLLEMIWPFQRFSALSWQAHGLLIGVAIPFLLVGSLVWYAGHQRRLSRLFFGHCAAVVLCCLFWPLAPVFRDLILLLALGAIALLFHFLWDLPHQYLALLAEDAPQRARAWRLVRILTESGGGIGGAGGILLLSHHDWSPLLEPWLAMGALLYLSVGWWWSWIAYRGTEEPRERQQLRLVWMGTVVALLPPLGLLVLPRLFHLPGDPLWLSLLALPVFPFVLGYAILRFQLLVPDRIIQRVALWLLRGLLFPLLIALIVGTGLTFFAFPGPALAIFLALSLAGLGPLLWWGTRALVPVLFAQDMPSLAAFLQAPPPVANLEEAVALLTSAITLASSSRQVCLCLCLDGQRVCVPMPAFAMASREGSRLRLLQQAHYLWGAKWSEQQPFFLLPEALCLELETHTWLSLQHRQEQTIGSPPPRWLPWRTVEAHMDVLALPLRAPTTGRLCALLLLGAAEDGQPYAGADLERVMQVLETASPWLAQSQQQEETRRQDWFLGQVYSGLLQVSPTPVTQEMVRAYAQLMASFGASVEAVWPEVPEEEPWLHVGNGPWLTPRERQCVLEAPTETARFCSSGEGDWSCAVACLPLTVATTPLTLVVTYPHPYRFLPREQKYWQVLAHHCQDRLATVARVSQHNAPPDVWTEQATLLTVLAGYLDLGMQANLPDTQASVALERAADASKRLLEINARSVRPWCLDSSACVHCLCGRQRASA